MIFLKILINLFAFLLWGRSFLSQYFFFNMDSWWTQRFLIYSVGYNPLFMAQFPHIEGKILQVGSFVFWLVPFIPLALSNLLYQTARYSRFILNFFYFILRVRFFPKESYFLLKRVICINYDLGISSVHGH